MKKIVCPHCGTINLEKFVTYPHCAGCSALLGKSAIAPRAVWWRRRVRAGWWAAGLGGAILLLVALGLSETDVRQNGPLVPFPQVPRKAKVGQTLDCHLSFNAVRDNGTSPQQLQNLRLRFGRNFEKQWQIVAIMPAPDSDKRTIAGRVLQYESWPIEAVWRVQLRARETGSQKFMVSIDAKDFLAFQYIATIVVAESDKAQADKAQADKTPNSVTMKSEESKS